MSFNVQERAKCACWYENENSVIAVQRKYKTQFGKNNDAPSAVTIKKWHKM